VAYAHKIDNDELIIILEFRDLGIEGILSLLMFLSNNQ
jgi:hypothetical protein